METVNQFWSEEKKQVAQRCEDKRCKLYWDNNKSLYQVLNPQEHCLFESKYIQSINTFIKSFNPVPLPENIVNKVYERRRILIDQANEKEIFIKWAGLKLPAKIAGAKLAFPMAYSGNLSVEISWKLAEKLANGEATTIIA